MPIPKVELILEYKHFYNVDPPADRIGLLRDICRKQLLFEIAALNYRLKPKNQPYINHSEDFQRNELIYFTEINASLRKLYITVFDNQRRQHGSALFFNRQACLYALEEITNSQELVVIENYSMSNIHAWESILKYFAAINTEVTKIKIEKGEVSSFETLNPKLLPLNELSVEVDPVFTIYRGYYLLKYLLNNQTFGNEIMGYFISNYGFEPAKFIYHLLKMYLGHSTEDSRFHCFYLIPKEERQLFNVLSNRVANDDIFKLIGIRKSPFIHIEGDEYILSDSMVLIEKTFSQLIFDFWFDWVKNQNQDGKAKYTIKFYKGQIGLFLESYLKSIIDQSLKAQKYTCTLLFEELKIKIKGSEEEIADIYFRYDDNILLGQVKSGNINDTQRYGGDIESLYQKGRAEFFENFGVNQMVTSIVKMDDHIQALDGKYPKNKTIHLFPVIVISDKVFQTPFMANLFNDRFKELIKDKKIGKININPLTVIHVNDLEQIQSTLQKNPKLLWELLRYNFRDKTFISPFYNTVDKYRKQLVFPEHVVNLYDSIIRFYEGKGSDTQRE